MTREEAPEKIWVHELSAKELNVPLKEYHIEYTRTDAFIEKAVLYLIHNTSVVHYPFGDIREFKNHNFDEMLKDFKNYMKGE